MDESRKSKKKALVIFTLIFLALGGGVFVFFMFQGLGDFRGGDKINFHYGFDAKKALVPLFSYFSPTESDAEMAAKARKRLAARGLDVSLLDGSNADISDWMAKGGGAGGSSRNAGARGASAGRTSIPRLGGGLGGISQSGGGGSKTGSELKRFAVSGDAGNTRISKAGQGGQSIAQGKGTLSALASARAALGEGLKSGSAMTAKSKWDQGFGVGATGSAGSSAGKKGGELAYVKSGLVGLDHIKSGDIANLKTNDPRSLKINEPGAPQRDEAAEAKDPTLNKLKGKEGADEAKAAAQNLEGSMGKGAGGKEDREGGQGELSAAEMPPPEVIDAAVEKYCPNGCDLGDGHTYKDNQITCQKQPNGDWTIRYDGTQDGQRYQDTMNIAIGPDGAPKSTFLSTFVQQDGSWKLAEQGTNIPYDIPPGDWPAPALQF